MNYIKTLKYLYRVLNARDEYGIMSNPLKYLKYNLRNAPRKIYKYRECTDVNFDNLENENIFLTKASEFSDNLDISLLFDLIDKISYRQIIKLYKKECLCRYIEGYYKQYRDLDDIDISPHEVKELFRHFQFLFEFHQ